MQFIPNVYAPAKDNTDVRHEESEHALHSFQSSYTSILIRHFADLVVYKIYEYNDVSVKHNKPLLCLLMY